MQCLLGSEAPPLTISDLEEDPLYQVLDKLHPHRFAIEAALVKRERSLFNLDRLHCLLQHRQ